MKHVVYPAADIERVGNTLCSALQRELNQGRGISSVADVWYRSQQARPTIYLLNADRSPFSQENALTQMPKPAPPSGGNGTAAGPSTAKRGKRDEPVKDEAATNGDTCHPITYQCDLCDFSDPSLDTVKSHVKTNRHQSLSRYRGLVSSEDASETVVALETPLFYQHVSGQSDREFGSLVSYCPTCFLPFPNKFIAAYHYQLHHDRLDKYCIAPVLLDQKISFTTAPKCPSCDLKFSRTQQLHKHWASTNWSCAPFPLLPDSPGAFIVLLQCTQCTTRSTCYLRSNEHQTRLQSVLMAFRNHVVQSHEGSPATIHLLYVNLSPGVCTPQQLAPMVRREPDELVPSLLCQSRTLKKYFQSFLGLSKVYVTKVSEEEKTLKKLLT